MAQPIRRLVSKKKRRYVEGDVDLDLSYIIPNRLIAMGYPAENLEGFYRNPLDDVVKFLQANHQNHYKVFNLCSERAYDASKIAGPVERYPFDDHQPPPFPLIDKCCSSIHQWLESDPSNCAVVHCKAGKGRTGLIICCYLMFCNKCPTALEAMQCYATRRTINSKGVTIPSQQRYIYYYECYLKQKIEYRRTILRLWRIDIVGFPDIPLAGNSLVLQSTVHQMDEASVVQHIHTSINYQLKRSCPNISLNLDDEMVQLQGDIQITLRKANFISKNKLFSIWLNTFFVVHGSSPLMNVEAGIYSDSLVQTPTTILVPHSRNPLINNLTTKNSISSTNSSTPNPSITTTSTQSTNSISSSSTTTTTGTSGGGETTIELQSGNASSTNLRPELTSNDEQIPHVPQRRVHKLNTTVGVGDNVNNSPASSSTAAAASNRLTIPSIRQIPNNNNINNNRQHNKITTSGLVLQNLRQSALPRPGEHSYVACFKLPLLDGAQKKFSKPDDFEVRVTFLCLGCNRCLISASSVVSQNYPLKQISTNYPGPPPSGVGVVSPVGASLGVAVGAAAGAADVGGGNVGEGDDENGRNQNNHHHFYSHNLFLPNSRRQNSHHSSFRNNSSSGNNNTTTTTGTASSSVQNNSTKKTNNKKSSSTAAAAVNNNKSPPPSQQQQQQVPVNFSSTASTTTNTPTDSLLLYSQNMPISPAPPPPPRRRSSMERAMENMLIAHEDDQDGGSVGGGVQHVDHIEYRYHSGSSPPHNSFIHRSSLVLPCSPDNLLGSSSSGIVEEGGFYHVNSRFNNTLLRTGSDSLMQQNGDRLWNRMSRASRMLQAAQEPQIVSTAADDVNSTPPTRSSIEQKLSSPSTTLTTTCGGASSQLSSASLRLQSQSHSDSSSTASPQGQKLRLSATVEADSDETDSSDSVDTSPQDRHHHQHHRPRHPPPRPPPFSTTTTSKTTTSSTATVTSTAATAPNTTTTNTSSIVVPAPMKDHIYSTYL